MDKKRNYNVTITEILERKLEVEASSKEEAIASINEEYLRGDIVLDSSDFKGVDIK